MTKPIKNVVHVGLDEGLHKTAIRMAKSEVINFDGATSVAMFTLPPNSLVLEVVVHTIEAFDPSGTSAKAGIEVVVPVSTGTVAVFGTSNAPLQSVGFTPAWEYAITTGGDVTALLSPGTSTVGQAQVYVEYITQVDAL